MSVLVKDRTLSKYEFYSNALRLRTALTHLLLKDLGVKNKERNFRFVGNNMSEEDKEIFDTLIAKYGISEFANEYPKWIIEKFRDSLWDIMRDMLVEITRAYTVFPTNIFEAYDRRNHMDAAIADCESLLKELEFAITILPINADKYVKFIDMIKRETALLKGWRKKDNKRIKEMQQSTSIVK